MSRRSWLKNLWCDDQLRDISSTQLVYQLSAKTTLRARFAAVVRPGWRSGDVQARRYINCGPRCSRISSLTGSGLLD